MATKKFGGSLYPEIPLLYEGKRIEKIANKYHFFIEDETDIIFHIRAYESRSVLLRNISPAFMLRSLDKQLTLGLQGILQDIVRLVLSIYIMDI